MVRVFEEVLGVEFRRRSNTSKYVRAHVMTEQLHHLERGLTS